MYEINRKFTWSTLKAGTVITISITILFIAVFFTGAITNLIKPKTTLIICIPNAQGLRRGAPVWLHGIETGYVNAIKIQPNGAIIEIALKQELISYIHDDATAQIVTMGIMGDKFVEINPGSSDVNLSTNDTIEGFNVDGFEDIISTSTSTMAQLDSTARNLTILINTVRNDSGSIGKLINDSTLYDNVIETFNSLSSAISHFKHADGTMNRLIYDSTLYLNISGASLKLMELIYSMDGIINNIEYGIQNGTVAGALLNKSDLTDSLRLTISSYKNTAELLSKLIEEIKLNPKKFFNFKFF